MTPQEIIKEEAKTLRKKVQSQTLGYILTALGLVAGLAWNEAIKSAIEVFFPGDTDSIFVQFMYAIIVTIAVVIIANYLSRYLAQEEKE